MLFKKDNENNDIKLMCLKSTNDNYELTTIKSILEDNDIPYILQDNEAGGFVRIYTGTSLYCINIMINKEDFNKVNELINDVFPEKQE